MTLEQVITRLVVLLWAAVVVRAKIGVELEGGPQVEFATKTTERKFFFWKKELYSDWVLPKPKSTPIEHVIAGAGAQRWGVKMDVDVGKTNHAHFELVSDPPTDVEKTFMGQMKLMAHMGAAVEKALGGFTKIKKWCDKQRKEIRKDKAKSGQSTASADPKNSPLHVAPPDWRLIADLPKSDYSTAGDLDKLGFGLTTSSFQFTQHGLAKDARVGITRVDCFASYPDISGAPYAIDVQATAAFKLSSFGLLGEAFKPNNMFACVATQNPGCVDVHKFKATAEAAVAQLDKECKKPEVEGFVAVVQWVVTGISVINSDQNPKDAAGPLLVRSTFNSMFEAGVPAKCKTWVRENMSKWVTAILQSTKEHMKNGKDDVAGSMFPQGVTLKIKSSEKDAAYINHYINDTFTRKEWIETWSKKDDAKDLLKTFRKNVSDVPNATQDLVPIHPSLEAMFDVKDDDKVDDSPVVIMEMRRMRPIPSTVVVEWGQMVWDFVKDVNEAKLTGEAIAEKYKKGPTKEPIHKSDRKKSVEQQVLQIEKNK